MKELLRFFIDNDLGAFAELLVLGKDHYPDLLGRVWETFTLKPGYVGIKPYEDLEKMIVRQNPIDLDNYGHVKIDGKSSQFEANSESKKLAENRLVEYIKGLKEIYTSVSNNWCRKSRKQDAIDRAKAVKGLKNFEGLLGRRAYLQEEQRLFILDLCSLMRSKVWL